MEYDIDQEKRSSTRFRQATLITGIIAVAFAIAFIVTLIVLLTSGRLDSETTIVPLTTTPQSNITTATTPTNLASYRLPQIALPLEYNVVLDIQIPWETERGLLSNASEWDTFYGNVTIKLQITRDTKMITLHSLGLTYPTLPQIDDDSSSVNIISIDAEVKYQFLHLHLDRMMYVGEIVNVKFEYSGTLQTSDFGGGLYYTQYVEEDLSTHKMMDRVLAVTQFESTDARRMIPCFDEPAYKANFTLTVQHNSKFKSYVRSNMPVDMSNEKDSPTVTVFQQTPIMSTYLFALFIGNFDCQIDETNKPTISICAQPTLLRNNAGGLPLVTARKSIEFFEDFVDVLFPLPKLDLIALPSFKAGGMENWGMITCKERFVLYDSTNTPPPMQIIVRLNIAHEIAHHWFGDLVTMQWWNDIWLNEGFAAFLQSLGADYSTDPKGIYREVELRQYANDWNAMDEDQSVGTETVDQHGSMVNGLATPDQIKGIFDAITYDKGSSIIEQVQMYLGGNSSACDSSENFRTGLHNYLTAPSINHGNADHADLYYYWQEAYDNNKECTPHVNQVNVSTFMTAYIEQPGFPLLTVTRPDKSTLMINQSRYTLEPNDYTTSWNIHFVLTTGLSDSNITLSVDVYMTAEQQQMRIPIDESTGWYTISGGYRRVLYPKENYLALAQLLINNTMNIDELNAVVKPRLRAQLLGDAFTFASADQLDYETVFKLMEYLRYAGITDDDKLVWLTITEGKTWLNPGGIKLGAMNYISRMFQFDDDYKGFITRLIEPQLSLLDNTTEIDDQDVLKFSQQSMVASFATNINIDPKLTEQYFDMYNKMTMACNGSLPSSSCNTIPPNLRMPIYCSAVANSGSPAKEFEIFKQLQMFYNLETFSTFVEKQALMYGMSCVKHHALEFVFIIHVNIIYSYLTQLIEADDELGFEGLALILLNPSTVWNLVPKQWTDIQKTPMRSTIIEAATGNLNTEKDLKDVQDFMGRNREAIKKAGLTERFNVQLGYIKKNIKWMKEHGHEVRALLKQ